MARRNNFLWAILIMFVSNGFAVESRLRDGIPEFSVANVNGIVCWTLKERDQLLSSLIQFSSTSPVIVIDNVPSNYELNISTSGMRFINFSEYLKCIESKKAMNDKILDLLPSIANDLKESLDYIKSENNKKSDGVQ